MLPIGSVGMAMNVHGDPGPDGRQGRAGPLSRADPAQDRPPRRPRPVVAAEHPEDAGVRAGVAAVEGVAVVELDEHGQRLVGIARPPEDLLAPQHAQVVVHAALADELALRRVPQRVVGARAGQLVQRVHVRAGIAGVRLEVLLRPRGQRGPAIVVLAVRGEPVAELAPGDQLVEEGLRRRAHVPVAGLVADGTAAEPAGIPALLRGERGEDLVHRQLPVVEVRREARAGVPVGIVARLGVAIEAGEEGGEPGARRPRAAGDR
jgi:hypothetical protein